MLKKQIPSLYLLNIPIINKNLLNHKYFKINLLFIKILFLILFQIKVNTNLSKVPLFLFRLAFFRVII